MSPKEILFKAGRIPAIGRGRISVENKQWLKDNGHTFEKPTNSVDKPAPKAAQGSEYILDVVYTYPESEYRYEGPKGTGIRNVCDTCKVSFVFHGCLNPTVLQGQPVKIVRK